MQLDMRSFGFTHPFEFANMFKNHKFALAFPANMFQHFFLQYSETAFETICTAQPSCEHAYQLSFFWCIFATDMNITKQCVQLSQPKNDREKMF